MTRAEENLDRIYATHPFQRRTILARLAATGVPLQHLDERSLAIDENTEITDQNHVGGAAAVEQLAVAARITSRDRIADVGAGLGGSARLLAATFGCHVYAVEQDRRRCEEAIELTRLTGLNARVQVVCLDAAADAVPDDWTVDVLWGQAAWAHIDDKSAFLAKWGRVVADNGRVAMEDAYVRREPRAGAEAALLTALQRSWSARLEARDEWVHALEAGGFAVSIVVDLTDVASRYFTKLLAVSERWTAGTATEDERRGWRQAVDAIDRGLLGYIRMVGWKSTAGDDAATA